MQKVNLQPQSSSSDQSDENCNYTLELVDDIDNEVLDNDMIDENYSDSSSLTSSNTTSNGSMDLNSYSDEDGVNQTADQEDLINQFSYSSNNSSKSDPFPESMSSSESMDHRFSGNFSPSFSFTSLLLEESDDVNNNEQQSGHQNVQQQPQQPHSSSSMGQQVSDKTPSSSPFTSKIVNMIKRKLN